jgi:glucose-6-phosphate 1-dehydrogenase
MLDQLVIFGGTGDLAARLLLPALAHLRADGDVPETLRILGVGQEDWTRDRYRDHVRKALTAHAADLGDVHGWLLERVDYASADVTDAGSVAHAVAGIDGPWVAYLALPPALFAPTLRAVADAGLPDGSVVAIEKPFGTDLTSARDLNTLLRRRFGDVTVFRNDHFLHNRTVQNIAGIRFANRLFEPLWNATQIEAVEVTWDETLTLEGRAAYYDSAGALRDMLANHLLQILCLLAMEPPPTFGERDLRDARFAVLRAIPTPDREMIRRHTVRARYAAGRVGDREVPDYAAEPGVDPQRNTETFAQVTLAVGNWRWAGVPFTLRSGKAQGADRAEAVVHLRQVPHAVFAGNAACRPNALRIGLEPPTLSAHFNINDDSEFIGLEPVTLHTALPASPRPAYADLIRDVLAADATLAVRGDEAEEAWRIMQPIIDVWSDDVVPMRTYPAGTTPDFRAERLRQP